ncbi:MAG: (2Fe-2S)-binding protein [Alphaproteobacteria bacterium]|nr:(2Fe-2S)-binding protein [Alphaproteobacteria bacterium]
MPQELILDLRVNGDRRRVLAPANRSLLDLLREDLGLTGSKHGCDVGDCGACTVLLDGRPRLACITLAAEADGRALTTVEGVGRPDAPHPIQQAFHERVAAQCGYCTPGFVVALSALLAEEPDPDDARLREVLGANICRCTGYTKILDAARLARERMNGRATE